MIHYCIGFKLLKLYVVCVVVAHCILWIKTVLCNKTMSKTNTVPLYYSKPYIHMNTVE